jgi:cyclopropane fatty-acyl-phospholipid synthase-like methyltransferase
MVNVTSALPDPSVPATVYDEEYYRTRCAGYADWTDSDGARVAGIYPGFLQRASLRRGETVVDLGTGRGELLVTAIDMGAVHAYGVEYSPAAVRMARQTIEVHGAGDRAEVVLADARSVPLPDECADLVCLLDVVEHLTPDELHAALTEARRMLRPGGRVVAHTMPNRLTYDVTYRALRPIIGRSWPKDPRNSFERAMHVNEQTLRSLRRSFSAAGFETTAQLGTWIRADFPPTARARRIYRALARLGPLAQLAVSDIWAFGTKP